MSSSPKILILGAAGYIGGTLLVDLLKTHPANNITTLVRDEAKQALLTPLGVNAVVGAVEDVPLLISLVENSDVVINFAVPFGGGDASLHAIVDTLEKRAKTSSIKPVYIHTSGSGSVLYGSDGVTGTDVWKDTDYERWEALPDTAYFHSGSRITAKAAERGVISAYNIMSPTVYGPGTGPGNKLSLQIPAYVRYAKRTGTAAYIGQGENVWGNVHIADVSRLYVAILDYALSNPAATTASAGSHGWSNLIYSGIAQHTWKPVVELLGDQLYARGDIPNKGAKSIAEGEGDPYMFGGNSFLAVSSKTQTFGWAPREPAILEAVKLALASK